MAITDHDNITGAMEFSQAAKELGDFKCGKRRKTGICSIRVVYRVPVILLIVDYDSALESTEINFELGICLGGGYQKNEQQKSHVSSISFIVTSPVEAGISRTDDLALSQEIPCGIRCHSDSATVRWPRRRRTRQNRHSEVCPWHSRRPSARSSG